MTSIGPPAAGAGMDLWDPHGLAVVLGLASGAYAVLATVHRWLRGPR